MNVGYDDGSIFKKRALRFWRQDYGLQGCAAGATRDSRLTLAAHMTEIALVEKFGTAMNAMLCHMPDDN
jgi:hypothetical protein